MRGLEPPTPGTTIQCSNQLSYIHRGEQLSLVRGLETVNAGRAKVATALVGRPQETKRQQQRPWKAALRTEGKFVVER
jgi:hypothetical protein